MFDLRSFPTKVRDTFLDATKPWPILFQVAIDARVNDVDDCTNLIFYRLHDERMVGTRGTPLGPGEPHYDQLAAEWISFRDTIVRPRLETQPGKPHRPDMPQNVSPAVARRLQLLIENYRSSLSTSSFSDEVAKLSNNEREAILHLLVLWPEWGKARQMSSMMHTVSDSLRASDRNESAQARFAPTTGRSLKDEMSRLGKATPSGKCLEMLYDKALPRFYAPDDSRYPTAFHRFLEISADRRARKKPHAGTLSGLASEMRLQGLVAPIAYIAWRGGAVKGGHEQDPVEVVDRFSVAGDGWYFFLCAVISYHTFLIAVEVSGDRRTYWRIEDGKFAQKETGASLSRWFKEWRTTKGAGTRLWAVRRP